MKKFLMVTPQQRPGQLNLTDYEAIGNELLDYGPTHFPLIPLINGYAERGDGIQVVALTFDSDECRHNLDILGEDVASLAKEKGISCEVVPVEVPFDSSTESVLEDFQKLIACVEDGDELYACITFGTKPVTVAMMMVLRYASRVKRDVSVECVVYGEQNYHSDPPTGKIYDMTSLVKLDDLVCTLAGLDVSDPDALVKRILAM